MDAWEASRACDAALNEIGQVAETPTRKAVGSAGTMKPKKNTMMTANDRIGDAPEISGSRPAYRDGLHRAMIAAA